MDYKYDWVNMKSTKKKSKNKSENNLEQGIYKEL